MNINKIKFKNYDKQNIFFSDDFFKRVKNKIIKIKNLLKKNNLNKYYLTKSHLHGSYYFGTKLFSYEYKDEIANIKYTNDKFIESIFVKGYNLNNNIVEYKFIERSQAIMWLNLIKKFNIDISKDKKYFFPGSPLSWIEVFSFLSNKKSINIKNIYFYGKIYNDDKDNKLKNEYYSDLNILQKHANFNGIEIDKNKINQKFDFCLIDCFFNYKSCDISLYNYNHFCEKIYISLKNLNENGDIFIYIPSINNKIFFDIIYLLTKYFNSYEIDHDMTEKYYSLHSYKFAQIYLKGFNNKLKINDLKKLFDEFKKLKPNFKNNKNLYKDMYIIDCDEYVQDKIKNYSLFNFDEQKNFKLKVSQYYEKLHDWYFNNLNYIINYLKYIYNNTKEEKRFSIQRLKESINLLEYLDLKVDSSIKKDKITECYQLNLSKSLIVSNDFEVNFLNYSDEKLKLKKISNFDYKNYKYTNKFNINKLTLKTRSTVNIDNVKNFIKKNNNLLQNTFKKGLHKLNLNNCNINDYLEIFSICEKINFKNFKNKIRIKFDNVPIGYIFGLINYIEFNTDIKYLDWCLVNNKTNFFKIRSYINISKPDIIIFIPFTKTHNMINYISNYNYFKELINFINSIELGKSGIFKADYSYISKPLFIGLIYFLSNKFESIIWFKSKYNSFENQYNFFIICNINKYNLEIPNNYKDYESPFNYKKNELFLNEYYYNVKRLYKSLNKYFTKYLYLIDNLNNIKIEIKKDNYNYLVKDFINKNKIKLGKKNLNTFLTKKNLPFQLNINKIKKLLKKDNKYFPECKLIKLQTSSADRIYYKNIRSSEQLKALVDYTENNPFNDVTINLMGILSLENNVYFNSSIIKKLIKKNMSDYKIYSFIHKYYKVMSLGDKNNKNNFGQDLLYMLSSHNLKIDKYLDLSGDPSIGNEIQKFYNLNNKNVEQCAFRSISSFKILKGKLVNYKLPFKNNEFSLVTCCLTLQNVEKLDIVLNEINRVLKKNGLLVIVENNTLGYTDKMLCDVMYIVNNITQHDRIPNKDLLKKYYAQYYSMFEWHYIMDKFKFSFVKKENLYGSIYKTFANPKKLFCAIYKKN